MRALSSLNGRSNTQLLMCCCLFSGSLRQRGADPAIEGSGADSARGGGSQASWASAPSCTDFLLPQFPTVSEHTALCLPDGVLRAL